MIVVLVRCLRNSAGWGAEEPSHLPPGSGPGIRMNLAKLGSSNGIEVVDSNNRHLALPSVRGSRELDTEPPKCRMHPFQPQSETLRMLEIGGGSKIGLFKSPKLASHLHSML